MERIRLHKFIAICGVASRRAAERMMRDGRVTVNGKVITQAGYTINPLADRVELDGHRLKAKQEKQYYILYKPAGVLTTTRDPFGRPTVMGFLPRGDLFPVGRLDLNTTGLLLFTDNGELAYRLSHPRFEIKKKYRVLVKGTPEESKLKLLREGIRLEDGRTSPARVKLAGKQGENGVLHITIHEGKKRQVRRMCSAIGHPVLSLKRVAFAFLTLHGLNPGEYRRLTSKEVQRLIYLTVEDS